ncbi:MAG: CorA family divalent cation transporter [Methanomassiliicoccales archaeon]|jgi:magnesium transporter
MENGSKPGEAASGKPMNGTPEAEHNGNGKAKVICVSIPLGSNRPVKSSSQSPADFIPTVNGSTLSWLNCGVDDLEKDGTAVATMYGFGESLVPTLLKGYYAAYEDRETELGIMVPAVRVRGLELTVFPLLILVRKNLILTIHDSDVQRLVQFSRYADIYLKKLPDVMPAEDKLTMTLFRILDENNTRNFEQLREIEEQADEMSQVLVDPNSPRTQVGKQIYGMKHSLITYLNTLWRTLDVVNSLRFGDADTITDNQKVLSKIGLLADDLNRQISLSEHMSEVLASGLEVLQSLYNNQLQILNNRMSLTMTWLTILGTAVLVPNTLATIFGFALNVDLHTLIWTLGVITIATVNSTLLAYWWVKKRVNLPKKADEFVS